MAGILPALQSGIKQHESEGSDLQGHDEGGKDGHLKNILRGDIYECFYLTVKNFWKQLTEVYSELVIRNKKKVNNKKSIIITNTCICLSYISDIIIFMVGDLHHVLWLY